MLIYNVHLIDASCDCMGAVHIHDGRIASVHLGVCAPADAERLAASLGNAVRSVNGEGLVLMPSFIDMHAHFRYPGQPQKETLETGLRAAAAGGFGTLVLMPNTNPVISSVEEAVRVQTDAAVYGLADVYQTMSLTAGFDGVTTDHLEQIPLVRESPQFIPVVTEDGRDVASSAVMLQAMQYCAVRGVIVSCHSEDTALAAAARPFRQKALELLARGTPESCAVADGALRQANMLLALAEDTATERNLLLARAAGCRVHIAHVSTARSLEAVRRARRETDAHRVTCEVTPHHLGLCGDSGMLLHSLVNPPLRGESDRQAVIAALCDGTADVISTDHAPHSAEEKAKGLEKSAMGITGLETAFPVLYTKLVKTGVISLERLVELMAVRPREIFGIEGGSMFGHADPLNGNGRVVCSHGGYSVDKEFTRAVDGEGRDVNWNSFVMHAGNRRGIHQ